MLINGTLLRQFDGSSLGLHVRLSDIWDIPSNENIFIMMDSLGIISLKRNSFELIKIFKPNDGIFPINLVAGAALINDNTIIWSNITRKTNLTELRIWNFVTQDNSSSILLSNESLENLDLMPSYIGFDYNTRNILLQVEIRWGEWLGWVEADHSQLGSLIINDSLIVVTSNNSNFVLIQKFIDNDHYHY